MPQLAVMRPCPILDLGNKLRLDKDCVALPPSIDCGLADDQPIHLLAQLACRAFVKSGTYSPDIDKLAFFARGEQQPADTPE